MAKIPQEADKAVYDLFDSVKSKHHKKRLDAAEIVVLFNEDKPFKKNRFNWGKVKKCSPETRALVESTSKQHDFLITIPGEGWNFLDQRQKEGWVDLLLTRCSVEYEPETDEKHDPQEDGSSDGGGKKKKKPKKIKDALGRIKYTDLPKYDDNGDPKWVVEPLDLQTVTDNVSRYGAWFPDFKEFGDALKDSNRQSGLPAA